MAGAASDNNTSGCRNNWKTYYIRSEFATGCFTVKYLVTVNPLPTLTVVNPAAVCSSNGRYYQQHRSNYKYGNNY
jgi:hypothetical protein